MAKYKWKDFEDGSAHMTVPHHGQIFVEQLNHDGDDNWQATFVPGKDPRTNIPVKGENGSYLFASQKRAKEASEAYADTLLNPKWSECKKGDTYELLGLPDKVSAFTSQHTIYQDDIEGRWNWHIFTSHALKENHQTGIQHPSMHIASNMRTSLGEAKSDVQHVLGLLGYDFKGDFE